MTEEISHKGVIKEISDKRILVEILSESACSGCHAKGFCSVADRKEKDIEIHPSAGQFHIGQMVAVTVKASQGFRALAIGYLFPFILLTAILSVTLSLTGNEGVSGLMAVLSLVPYYFGVYLFRNKLKKRFDFGIGPLT